MDEYLFLTMARLKADRLELERQQRGAEPREQLRLEGFEPVDTHRHSARQSSVCRWFSQQPLWREQS